MEIPKELKGEVISYLVDTICGYDITITRWTVTFPGDQKAQIHNAAYEQLVNVFKRFVKMQKAIKGNGGRIPAEDGV